MRTLLLLSLLFYSLGIFAKSVSYYRCTAENGEMTLSDRPCGDNAENLEVRINNPIITAFQEKPAVPEAAPVTPEPTEAATQNTPRKSPAPLLSGSTGKSKKSKKAKEDLPRYTSVGILSPKNGEVIRAENGNVPVAITSTPGLQSGDIFQILVDGKEIARSSSNRFVINGIDKGRSALAIIILDKNGKMQIQSSVIRFILF